MTDIALSAYVNGPYEEDPEFEDEVTVNGIADPVDLRLYWDALVICRKRGPTYIKYPLTASTSVRADEKTNVFVVSFPADAAGAVREDLVIRTASHSLRDEWVSRLQLTIVAIRDGGMLNPAHPVTPPEESRAIAKRLAELAMAPVDPLEVRTIVRCLVQALACMVLFACFYVGVTRNVYMGGVLNCIVWGLVQPQYYIFPWVLGPKALSFLLVVGVVGVNVAFNVYMKTLYYSGIQYPDPRYITWSSIRSVSFSTSLLFGITGIWYIVAWRRGLVPRNRVILGRRGRCQRDMHVYEMAISILGGFAIAILECLSSIYNGSTFFLVISTSIYCILIIFAGIFMYIGRRQMREFTWHALLRYCPTLSFGTFTIGRLTRLLIGALLVNGESLDTFLPFIFVVYKLLFVALYPYFASIALRMGKMQDQMKYLFPVQILDALILDAFAVVSKQLSAYHIIFVLARIIFAVSTQAGLLRKFSDRMGLTERSWKDLIPANTDVNRVAPSVGDAATDAQIKLYAVMREPCGDSPLAGWLFFVQGSLAGVISATTLLLAPALDAALPGRCVLVCGISLAVVEVRAVISLFAWLVSISLTFVLARNRMTQAGFGRAELVHLTARHLRSSLPVLMTFGLPIVCYMLTQSAGYIMDVNGVAHPPVVS